MFPLRQGMTETREPRPRRMVCVRGENQPSRGVCRLQPCPKAGRRIGFDPPRDEARISQDMRTRSKTERHKKRVGQLVLVTVTAPANPGKTRS